MNMNISIQNKSRALMQRRYQVVKRRQKSMLVRTAGEIDFKTETSDSWNSLANKLNAIVMAA